MPSYKRIMRISKKGKPRGRSEDEYLGSCPGGSLRRAVIGAKMDRLKKVWNSRTVRNESLQCAVDFKHGRGRGLVGI